MNIVSILEGIEKLVVDFVMWILLIPRTLRMILENPGDVPEFVERELSKSTERFDGYISPVLLFLVCSAVMFFLMDLVVSADHTFVEVQDKLLKALQGPQGVAAAMGFLLLPLFLGLVTHASRKTQVTGEWLRRVLYIQCCYCAPLTLSVFSFGFYSASRALEPSPVRVIADSALVVLCVALLVWFVIVEIQLFAKQRGTSIGVSMAALVATAVAAGFAVNFLVSAFGGGFDGRRVFIDSEYIRDYRLPSTDKYHITLTSDDKNKGRGTYKISLSKSTDKGVTCATARYFDVVTGTSGDAPLDGGKIKLGEAVVGKLSESQTVFFSFDGIEGDRIHLLAEALGMEEARPEGGYSYWWIDIQHADSGSSILTDDLSDEDRRNRGAIPYILLTIYVVLIGWGLGKGIFRSLGGYGFSAYFWVLIAVGGLSALMVWAMNTDATHRDRVRQALSDEGVWEIAVTHSYGDPGKYAYTLRLARLGRNLLEDCPLDALGKIAAEKTVDGVPSDTGATSNILKYGGIGRGEVTGDETDIWFFQGSKHDVVGIELSSRELLHFTLTKSETQ